MRGGVGGSQPMITGVHRSPNKLWRAMLTETVVFIFRIFLPTVSFKRLLITISSRTKGYDKAHLCWWPSHLCAAGWVMMSIMSRSVRVFFWGCTQNWRQTRLQCLQRGQSHEAIPIFLFEEKCKPCSIAKNQPLFNRPESHTKSRQNVLVIILNSRILSLLYFLFPEIPE
jgi:hypothetical protein